MHVEDERRRAQAAEAARRALQAREGQPLKVQLDLTRLARRYAGAAEGRP